MRLRLVATAAAAAALAIAPVASPRGGERSWAQPEIEAVAARGLLGGSATEFRPDDPLTRGELSALAAALTGTPAATPADPTRAVTIAQLNAALVRALGLRDTARALADGVRAAGLRPPARLGTEVVARRLGLRKNHEDDARERLPHEPATRAEAAYSAARILRLGDGELELVRRDAATFAPPPLAPPARDLLQEGISLVGHPYVWGGTSEQPQTLFGNRASGGFDCSGLVWRLFRVGDDESLAPSLTGRTTAELATGPKPRLGVAEPAAGDLVFFGPRGRRSRPAEIDHVGIYVGAGWFLNASEQGVTLSSLRSAWYAERLAWGRRPLAESPPSG
jgi:cell wall-associated NlpC family hydrolase